MAKYSKQNYVDLANILKEYRLVGWGYVSDESQTRFDTRFDTMTDIASDFANLFEQDNPNFDKSKFIKAATAGKR
jgi:hypothetical protein